MLLCLVQYLPPVLMFFLSPPSQGVVRDTAGYAVMLKWTMSNIYGLSPGEVRQ